MHPNTRSRYSRRERKKDRERALERCIVELVVDLSPFIIVLPTFVSAQDKRIKDDNIHRSHNDCWRLSQGVASEMPPRPCQRPNDRMFMSAMPLEHFSPALAPLSSLTTWFHDRFLYYILPNRIYYFLGAKISDSRGEIEWYQLMDITNCPADRADLM